MARITIVLLTYKRLDYALVTLDSTLRNAHYGGDLEVHIASDGDNDDYLDALKAVCLPYGIVPTSSNSQRGGYGRNYNLATQLVHIHTDYVLPLEDDWELTRELDLNVYVDALEELKAGCIRMGYIGFTQPLRGEFQFAVGRQWLRLDPSSPEPHVFAGHPRLETVGFERSVGPWPEGLEPGATEFAVAHIAESRQGVIWPVQEINTRGDMFVHIGAERSW